MTTPDFSTKDKLGLAALSLGFWMLIPVPFWFLTIGFAGELILPDFGLLGRGDFWVGFVFSLLFYAPLLLAGYALADVLRSKRVGE